MRELDIFHFLLCFEAVPTKDAANAKAAELADAAQGEKCSLVSLSDRRPPRW